MRKYCYIILSVIWVTAPATAFAQAISPCNIVSGEITDEVSDHPGRGWCLITPEAMQIKLHFIGLCATEPDWDDYEAKCSQLFKSDQGQLVTVEKNKPLPLIDEISLVEGTYSHAAIFIDRSIRHSSIVTFDSPRRGKSGDPGLPSPTEGKICWSLDVGSGNDPAEDDYANFGAECGNTASNVGYNTSENVILYDMVTNARGDISTGSTASTTWKVILLNENKERDPDLTDNEVDNAKYFIGIQKFNTPVNITPSLESVDLSFRLTNTFGVLMGHDDHDNDNTTPALNTVRRFVLGGFEFKVDAK